MFKNLVLPPLKGIFIAHIWFQQDNVTCLTLRCTFKLLKETFGKRIISPTEPIQVLVDAISFFSLREYLKSQDLSGWTINDQAFESEYSTLYC